MKHKVMNNRSVKKSRAIVAALVCNGFWGLSFMASDIALKESRDVIRNFFNGREAYAIFNMITNGEPEMENQRNFPFNEKCRILDEKTAGKDRAMIEFKKSIIHTGRRFAFLLLLFILTGLSTGLMNRTAHAAQETVQIRLKPCGGTADRTSVQVSSDGSVGRLPSATRTGYVFTGWYTKKNDGEIVTEKTPVASLTKHILYAHYKPITYQIRFMKNGVLDKAPETIVCAYGTACRLPGGDDAALDHWSTSRSDKGTAYEAGKRVKNLTATQGKTIKLYAIALSGKNNIEKLVRYFVRQGYTKEAAAGIAGNLMYESGGGPNDIKLNAVEYATGRGIGMVQWTDTSDGPRRTNFERFCASRGKPWPNTDLKLQIEFLMLELEGKYGKIWAFYPRMGYPARYKMSLAAFKRCKSVVKATRVFCANFERPYANDCGMDVRIQFAKIALRS